MSGGIGAHAPLRVGDWQLDAAAGELRRGGGTLRIEPKTMQLLLVLAGRAGHVVSREELMDAVWPGVVVGDDALTQAVIKLRKALGDEARAPAYIETIPKRGYRLVAAVERAPAGGETAGAAAAGDGTASPAAAVIGAVSSRGRGVAGIPTTGTAGARASLRRHTASLATLTLVLITGLLVWRLDGASWPPALTPQAAPAEAPTVAVLPFETLSGDAAERWLARGIGEDVATDLARSSALQLIAAEGSDDKPPARYWVIGTVQRAGAQLKLTVRLVEAAGGAVLWSARFEQPFDELPRMQEQLALQLAQALSVRLDEAERRRLAARYTRDVLAYEHFLHAQGALLVRQQPQNADARRLYRQAIELDPSFARAYAGLALTHAADFRNGWSDDGTASLARAFEFAETARGIDADIPQIYWVLAYVHAQRREHDVAAGHLRTAIALQPSYADAHALLGGIHTYAGRPGETLPHLRTALRLNPQGGYLYFLLLGRAYCLLGDTEQALINLREAALRNPSSVEVRIYLAAAHAAAGDKAAAAWEADEVRSLDAAFTPERWFATYPMTDAAQITRLRELLRKSGL